MKEKLMRFLLWKPSMTYVLLGSIIGIVVGKIGYRLHIPLVWAFVAALVIIVLIIILVLEPARWEYNYRNKGN